MMKKHYCHHCNEPVTPKTGFKLEILESPFSKESQTIWLHSDKKHGNEHGELCADMAFDSYYDNFHLFTCSQCQRVIYNKNPHNGWHSQMRFTEDGEEICLKCYESDLLENGIPAEKLESGSLPGMFFSKGNPEPLEAGYQEVSGFDNYFVRGADSVKRICLAALDCISKGQKVVIGYESLGIGGSEGYVTLFAKQ
jgi:hypothetical protein